MKNVYLLWGEHIFSEDELEQIGICGEKGLVAEEIPYLKLENIGIPRKPRQNKNSEFLSQAPLLN
ncbi:MAG: hypothetical protein LBV16_09620 [Elusimicrobiota bacterium]|jgi:hypothetical protein|nr:hypothetical protein [Elusimicrobiota bacterium]